MSGTLAARLAELDWAAIERELDAQGCARLPGVLSRDACRELASLYPHDTHFRSRIMMARHGFGRGEYRYFAYPLPPPVAEARSLMYARLAPVANRWNALLGLE
uniref:2OG-Fe(II) oxygenase n=1 Tax=Serratia marcescens TaxID=615 RepID=UPI001652C742